MACVETLDPQFDVGGQVFIGARHIDPDRVAADRRAFDAAKHRAQWRLFPPGRVAVPGVFVMVGRGIEVLVDADQAGMVRVAARHRMILQVTEARGKGYVVGLGNELVAQEQDFVVQ